MIGSGRTRHAESVQITYDLKLISYGKLLQIYFSVAQGYIAQLDATKVFPQKIVSQIAPLTVFYPAEAYHQDYAMVNPHSPYIA